MFLSFFGGHGRRRDSAVLPRKDGPHHPHRRVVSVLSKVSIWHSLKNLRKNLTTIRPYLHLHSDVHKLYIIPTLELWLDWAERHGSTDPYLAHFNSFGGNLRFGPFVIEGGWRDTN